MYNICNYTYMYNTCIVYLMLHIFNSASLVNSDVQEFNLYALQLVSQHKHNFGNIMFRGSGIWLF